jgi:hypothetical protein
MAVFADSQGKIVYDSKGFQERAIRLVLTFQAQVYAMPPLRMFTLADVVKLKAAPKT